MIFVSKYLMENVTSNIMEINDCNNSKDNNDLYQDLKNQDVELFIKVINANGDIRTRT